MSENVSKSCKGCGESMFGIMDYKARTLCEDCGGNTTGYTHDNPNPVSWRWLQLKHKATANDAA